MKKVSIIGAGNVGATAAQEIARLGICDEVVLIDIKEGLPEGKAIDIMQALGILGCTETKVYGFTSDYEKTKDSDIIVVTSGVPRKPGMTREELVGINAGVVKSVVSETHKYSPMAIYIVVSNPMDTMTYLTMKHLESLGRENAKTTVIGMGGTLDSSRLDYYLSKYLGCGMDEVSGYVLGGHGDSTMIPVLPGDIDIPEEDAKKIKESTMRGGATLTSLLGTSAWCAPAAAISRTVKAVLGNITQDIRPYSVYREEYGLCIGTLVSLGNQGVVEIYPEDSVDGFMESVEAVKKVNDML